MSNLNPHASILVRLRDTRRLLFRIETLVGVCRVLSLALILALLLAAVEATFHLSVTARSISVITSLIGIAGASIFFVGPPFLKLLGVIRSLSDDDVATLVGHHYPTLHDALTNALQLKRLHGDNSSVGYSLPLVEGAFLQVTDLAANLKFENAVDRISLKSSSQWTALLLLVIALVFAFVPGMNDAGNRLLHFSVSYVPPPPFVFEVTPGNIHRVRGDSVRVTIRTIGSEPQREIVLQTRESDQEYPRPTVLRSEHGTFVFTFDAVKRTTEYFVEAKNEISEKYSIVVTDRPEVKSLSLRLSYPSYTHTSAIDLEENSGDIIGIAGTEARFTIKTNKPVVYASILFMPDTAADSILHEHTDAKSEIRLQVSGMEAHGILTIRHSGSYAVHLVDEDGNGNTQGMMYRVIVLHDESPTIRVLQPDAVTDVTETSKLGIVTRIHDDFGFSRLVLHYRLSQSKYANPWDEFKATDIPFSAEGKTDLDVPYVWDLRPFGLVPEDALEFYVEVFDNDIISGPKHARSEMLTLRLPSLEAALHESDQAQSDAGQNLQEAERAAEELKQQMEQTTRELRQQSQEKNLSWQQQKKMQDMLKRQEKLQNKVAEAQQQLEDAVQKLETKQALSPETLQKYLELQKLFTEMKSPELLQAMKRLQESMDKLTPDQMRDAMKNFAVNEEQFRQSIERTMEMLKRIQAEQKVDELMKRAEQLQKQQDQIQQQAQNEQSKGGRDKLAAEQRDLEQRTQEMKKEFDELKKKMEAMGKDMPKDEMQKTEEQLKEDKPQEEMQKAEQQMSSDPQSSSEHQDKAKKGLQRFQQNMSGVKKKMQENEQKQMMTEMRRSLQDLLELSKREESLKQQTGQSEPNSSALPDLAKQQANAESDLGNVVNRMMSLAKKSFAVTPEMGRELGKALREMQNATGNLEQRQPQQAGQNEGNAVGAMNSAAMMMQQALQQMAQNQSQPGGGGGGLQSFMQQLNKMQGEQEQINGETEKLGNQGSMSREQQAQVQRLASQQAAVKQSLDELRRKQEQLTGGKKNTLGDLNKIADEMQEVINDMRSNNVKPETIQRQERILSRMLDAQRSQHERDFDKKREGKSGTAATRESPAPLPTQSKARSIDELLRLQGAGYTKDYERRIRKYFETLQGNVPQ